MFSDLNSEFFSLIRGALLALLVFHTFLYLNNKQKFFLYYAVFCFLFFVNLTFWNSTFFTNSTLFNILLPLQYVIIYVYFFYSREVLRTRELLPNWDKLIKKYALILFIVSILIYVSQVFINIKYVIILNFVLLIIIISCLIITYLKIKRSQNLLTALFILGAISVFLLGSTTFFINATKFNVPIFQNQIHPQTFMYFGILIEMIITAIVLGYRINTMEHAEESVVLKLAKQTAETEELRMEALKSQMNPHFIFNMLNSINSLIIKNENEKASDYITKFARFIREILNSSRKNSVSLADEIKTIKLYVILEQARVDGGFEFEVINDEKLSLDFIKIPSMFLQPFIENAIWHGLAHKVGNKKLTIKLSKKDEFYQLDVIDNGIGFNKGVEIANRRLVKSSGVAVEIVKNRLQSLYKNSKTDVTIEDISDSLSTGTKVSFSIPVN
jgi:sensor histidine kinase YesM